MRNGARAWFVILALGAVVVAPVHAQEPATTFSEVAGRVKPGANLVVGTGDGRTIPGRLVSRSDTSVVLDAGHEETIYARGVTSIATKGKPPVLKGLLIGLAARAGLGLAAIATNEPCEGFCVLGDDFAYAAAGVFMAVGAGAGSAVGAMIPPRTKLVYKTADAERIVALAPIVAPTRVWLDLRVVSNGVRRRQRGCCALKRYS